MALRIGNGAGFLGDQLAAPRQLVEGARIDYLTLEYLAELTMSILAYQKQKQPSLGYARDFLDALGSLLPALETQSHLKIITNGGGVNPVACARAAASLLNANGLGELRLGLVDGDDLLPHFPSLQPDSETLAHLDTGQSFWELGKEAVAANAYLGAPPIAAALAEDARIVITGRVADASLTLAPTVHHYGWQWNDWERLAAASVAGHLIECGAQVTGGYSQRWKDLALENVGYPIAEIDADGQTIITKPSGTGGRVDRQSVVEQMVYEIGDPRSYKTPDVDVDFTTVTVTDLGNDRVAVQGATGKPPSDHYKVSLAYHDGFMASSQLLVVGGDCLEKAEYCAAIVRDRLARAGYPDLKIHAELLGAGVSLPDNSTRHHGSEVMLRLTVRDQIRAAVERFTREIAPLITSGPAGLAGYAAARSAVRPVFAYWPTLISKSSIQPRVDVRTARDWLKQS